jgi:hypothetical protein
MNLHEVRYDVGLIHLVLDWNLWLALVITLRNVRVSSEAMDFLSSCWLLKTNAAFLMDLLASMYFVREFVCILAGKSSAYAFRREDMSEKCGSRWIYHLHVSSILPSRKGLLEPVGN